MEKQNQIDLSFEGLSYTIRSRQGSRDILKNIEGKLCSGRLNVLMGASGAGKTSLLNILSMRIQNDGRKHLIEGNIYSNGTNYNAETFNNYSAYVIQDNILMPTLTPRESIQFIAYLKCSQLSGQQIIDKTDRMIKQFKLDSCADCLIGGNLIKGISGGEKKRTSIACELITDPDLIILDEPTSGLDSFTSYLVVQLLKQYSQKGKTVIFTIHQPNTEIFQLFDRLLLLVEGKLIYQGNSQDSICYFQQLGYQCPQYTNPCEYFIEIMDPMFQPETKQLRYDDFYQGYDKKLKQQVKQEIMQQNLSDIHVRSTSNSFYYQTKQIAWRSIKNQYRNPVVFKGRIIQAALISLILSSVFYDFPDDPFNIKASENRVGILFFIIINEFLSAFTPTLLTFSEERLVFIKEVKNKLYCTLPYYLGKTIPELIPNLLIPVISISIAQYMIGFNSNNIQGFMYFVFSCQLNSFAGSSLSLFVSSLVVDSTSVISIAPMCFIPMILFSGYNTNNNDLEPYIRWFQHFSPFKYSFESVVQNEFGDKFYLINFIELFDLKMDRWNTLGYLVMMSLLFRVMTIISLRIAVLIHK